MPYSDLETRKQYKRSWRAANREKYLAQNRESAKRYRLKHPDYKSPNAAQTLYRKRAQYRSRILGIPVSEYSDEKWNNHQASQRVLYDIRKKERLKQHKRNVQKQVAKFVWEYKAARKCALCPEDHPAALTFHHRDPSNKKIAVSQCKTMTEAKREIEKCDLICANCHAKHHWAESQKGTHTFVGDTLSEPTVTTKNDD